MENRHSFKTVIAHIGTFLLTLVLCIGLLPYGLQAHKAWADDGSIESQDAKADENNEVTLVVVFGLDWEGAPVLALNKSYEFTEGDTLEDLFDQALAAQDLLDYSLNAYDYLQSVTMLGNITFTGTADSSLYWSMYIDGVYYDGSRGGVSTLELKRGESYQFAWESWPRAIAPSWDELAEPEKGDGIVGGTAGSTPVGSATLAIVYGIDVDGYLIGMPGPVVVINYCYDFAEDATLKDLLDHAIDDGYFFGYELNEYGFLKSVEYVWTITNTADFSLYWSMYVNGSYFNDMSHTIETLPLEDGSAYQFVWESYPTAAPPDWSMLGSPEGSGEEENDADNSEPADYSQETFNALFANISALFKGTNDEWKALELAAANRASLADLDAIIAHSIAILNNPEPGTSDVQRAILALTALGVDATHVVYEGQNYNFIEALATSEDAHNRTNSKMFTLLAYASGPYTPPAGALEDIDQLINDLLALQNADGGWSFLPGVSDADMTAMALSVLAPFIDDPLVDAAVKAALVSLRALQLENGGFASADIPSVFNTNSTAFVIVALAAVGIDVQTWTVGETQATPLNALLSQANASLNGFTYSGVTNDMATEQGFRALVAYQGFLNVGGAYNIYTQAASGLAHLDLEPILPQTGESPLLIAAVAAFALFGLLSLLVGLALRKKQVLISAFNS